MSPLVQNKWMRVRMSRKGETTQIGHLPLIPTQKGNLCREGGERWCSLVKAATQQREGLMRTVIRQVENLGRATRLRKPGIGHLEPRPFFD
jgi:hypothetical protein